MLLMISSEADKNAFSTFNKTHFKSFQVFLHKTGKRKFMAPLLGRRETLSPIGASRTCTCTSTCKCHSSRLSIKHAYVYFILWCTKSDELATFAMYMLFRYVQITSNSVFLEISPWVSRISVVLPPRCILLLFPRRLCRWCKKWRKRWIVWCMLDMSRPGRWWFWRSQRRKGKIFTHFDSR